MKNTIRKNIPVIICFDPLELNAFKSLLGADPIIEVDKAASPYYSGSCCGFDVGLLRLPFGNKVDQLNTALATLIDSIEPSEILVVGTAMALESWISIGDMCLTTHTQNELGNAGFSQPLQQEFLSASFHHKRPRLVKGYTSSVFIDSKALIDVIKQEFPQAEILEMEDLHIAKKCSSQGIPCASLRVISDYGSFDDHMKRLPKLIPGLVRTVKRLFRARLKETILRSATSGNEFKLPFNFYIRSFSREIKLPLGVSLATRISESFCLRQIAQENARVDIFVSPKLPESNCCPGFSGKGFFRQTPQCKIWIKENFTHFVFWLEAENLESFCKIESIKLDTLTSDHVSLIEHSRYQPPKGILPNEKNVHIQGLNSISAEAEEGLLAAATADEFQSEGYCLQTAEEAKLWIYRTANSSEESYFEVDYGTPFRSPGIRPGEVYCIATGLGPSISPAALGGYDAGTLILGDEMGGRLLEYIEDLSAAPFRPEDVFRYPGVIQRIGEDSMAISRMDMRFILSPQGINKIQLNPDSLRKVYTEDYDKFLKNYFAPKRRETYPKNTFLLLTSRGCGNECSICCSGGYLPFTPLSTNRVCELLCSVKNHFGLKENEYLEVFLLDSNFNKDPDRIIELADRLEKENLLVSFEFFIRHNGLQAFLLRNNSDPNAIEVNEKLIDAYQKLRIDEIVVGIDSYTDSSIQILKTNLKLLKSGLIHQPPSYRFDDIAKVVHAIEMRGIGSRGFLLMNNPFVSSSDRIQTFFNLLILAIECPRFIIDFSSSLRVNELKPFHGAPITRLAKNIPGVLNENRFHLPGLCFEIEQMLRFDIFNARRNSESQQKSLIAAAQETRFGLCDFLFSKCKELPEGHHAERNDVAAAAYTLLHEEKKLCKLLKADNMEPFFQKRENEISTLLNRIKHELERRNIMNKTGETPEQTKRFFQALDELE